MAYYRCSYCHELHVSGSKCPKRPKYKKKTTSPKFYRTTEWIKMREVIKNKFLFIDIWLLGKSNIVKQVPVGIVHHIEEYQKDKKLALEAENLIYCSVESHNEIHQLYDTFRKDEALEIIRRGLERFSKL